MIKLMNGCDFLLRLQFWFSNCYELNLVRYVLGCGISAPALGHLSSDFNKKYVRPHHLISRHVCIVSHNTSIVHDRCKRPSIQQNLPATKK